ncbi:MAG TPA: cupredoxin family copper-binding protein [Candidatus Peribacteraceae bacterium]|nr:cupredoxin family copper-binding protein [Candidatus Peribacteraceae bacterium]
MRTLHVRLLLISTLLLAACSSQSGTTSTDTTSSAPSSAMTNGSSVTIQNFQFAPQSITIKAGTTVTWTNQDSVSHTVTGDNGGPASGGISQGQTYSYTFTTPGTFTYHCTFHPMMKGTVVVTQ